MYYVLRTNKNMWNITSDENSMLIHVHNNEVIHRFIK